MAFYLKKTKLKGRTYLSIDESFYRHEKKGTAHKCYKSLGSVETWQEKGISDPISHFQKEVDALNQKKLMPEYGKYRLSPPFAILDISHSNPSLKKCRLKNMWTILN